MGFITTSVKLLYIILLCIIHFQKVEGNAVLFVPNQMKSHILMHRGVAQEMANRGHSVYMVLGDRIKQSFEEVSKDVGILSFKQKTNEYQYEANFTKYFASIILHEKQTSSALGTLTDFASEQVYINCNDMLTDDGFMSKVNDIKFDFMVVDLFHPSPCNVLLPHNLSVPFAMAGGIHVPWLFGVHTMPSVEPLLIWAWKNDHMDFFERVQNLLACLYIHDPVMFPGRKNKTLLQQFAPGESSWNDIANQADLTFIFRNYIIDPWPAPKMPNVIHLPGISYKDSKPLPSHLNQILDNSKYGVVLISFGSMGGHMQARLTRKFIQAFNLIPNMVIFSFTGNTEELLPIPKNVHIFKWLPQNDILGHRNTKLFITHAGLNGIMECIYHSVPMIAIPLFAEQPQNAKNIEKLGLGVSLDLFDFTAKELVVAITQVLENRTYGTNIKLRSQMLRNIPEKHPVNITADWIEYAMKYGTDHMKSKSLSMPFYKYFMLDIAAFFIVVIIIVIFVCFKGFSIMCYMCFKSGTKSKIKQN